MDIADQVLTDLAKGEEGLGRSKAHKVQRHALRRAAKRLRLVRDGEWGFIDLSKEAFKAAFPGIAVAGRQWPEPVASQQSAGSSQ